MPKFYMPLRVRLGLSEANAADYIGIPLEEFRALVADGTLPQPIIVDEDEKIWRRRELDPHIRNRGLVYFVGYGKHVKIGFTENLPSRISGLQTSCPYRIDTYVAYRATMKDERELHAKFAADRMHGEWFRYSPEIHKHIREAQRPWMV